MTLLEEDAPELAVTSPILELDDVVVEYDTPGGRIRPVDHVTLRIGAGETLGLVGESGCGKSTLGRLIIQLTRAAAGRVVFDGRDLSKLSASQLRALRKDLQVIFQDPRGSLDPTMAIRAIVAEPLKVHGIARGAKRAAMAEAMLGEVGLDVGLGDRRPMQLSGGQQQRVGIGRALITEPKLVVCDEPVSALDVSVQAQVINLLQDLKSRLGVAYLFISHNLAVVRHLSDRVAVMYLGQIVEVAPRDELFSRPRHPYTRVLLAASLTEEAGDDEVLAQLKGEPPSPIDVPSGCRFHPRCPLAQDTCHTDVPVVSNAGDDHIVTCHFWDRLPLPSASAVPAGKATP